MPNRGRVYKAWLTLTILAIIGGIIFGVIFLIPYNLQSSWLGFLARDGSVESFTYGVYYSTRFCFGLLTILSILSLVFLLGFKHRSQPLLRNILHLVDEFTEKRRKEIRDLVKAISPIWALSSIRWYWNRAVTSMIRSSSYQMRRHNGIM